ncbi:MAG: trypsin-like peptidase domain-containing protein [Candidatus Aenigmatarchaeota archaeon]
MSIIQINQEEYLKIKNIYKIFLSLTIVSLIEILTASIFKNFNNIELGFLGSLILFFFLIIGIAELGGFIASIIYLINSLLFLPSLIITIFLYFRLRKYTVVSPDKSVNLSEIDEKFSTIQISQNEYKKVFNTIIEIILTFLTIFFVIGTVAGFLLRSKSLQIEDSENTISSPEGNFVSENTGQSNQSQTEIQYPQQTNLLTCEPGAIPCNNKCWTPCSPNQRFICPSKGDAYCELEDEKFKNLSEKYLDQNIPNKNVLPKQSNSKLLNISNFVDKIGLIRCPLDENLDNFSEGSGFLIDKNGYVLTNYHVVEGAVDGYCIIGFTDDFKKPPFKYFLAYTTNLYDADLDYAVLYIEKQIYPEKKQITNRNFPSILACNSDIVNLGDPILIIGYPAYGEETLTVTSGIISGSLGLYYKTDAKVDKGNSGSPVLLDDSDYNCFIGVVTFIIRGTAEPLTYIIPTKLLSKIYNF